MPKPKPNRFQKPSRVVQNAAERAEYLRSFEIPKEHIVQIWCVGRSATIFGLSDKGRLFSRDRLSDGGWHLRDLRCFPENAELPTHYVTANGLRACFPTN